MDSAAAAASATVAAVPGAGKPPSEQKLNNPNPNSNPNARASRWSDAPPGSDVNSSAEPPHKKVRNDLSSTAGYGADVSGYGEGPPGLVYAPSAEPTEAAPTYGVAGYGGTGYGAQQQTTGFLNYGPQYQAPPTAHGSFAPGSAKGTSALFYKTKLCTKFKIGSCTFNERCHFAHGTEDLRKPPPGWESMVGAPAGATLTGTHGGAYMGQTRPKTRLCRYFADGNCPYGDRCNFLHGNEESQKLPGAGGPYTATGMQGPAVATDLQGYSGVSAYPNGGTVSSSMQYPNPNQGLAMPNAYADPSMVNPSSVAASYGATADYSAGALGSVAAQNMNPYASASVVNNYPSAQDGTSGASANYNYWNGPATYPTQGYVQANQTVNQGNQTASWMPNYAADSYSKRENEAAIPQYSQELPQHQQSVSTTPYMQVGTQNTHQGGTTHGDGSYYPGAYSETTYPNQQPDYTTRYNMAEAWGGKIQ